MTQAQQLANLSQAYTAGALGFRNRLINGGMEMALRGSTTLVANAITYSACDRWYGWSGGANVSSANDWSGPKNRKALHVAGASGNTSVNLGQRIEAVNCWDLAGTTVMASGYFYSDTGVAGTPAFAAAYPNSVDNWGGGVTGIAVGTPTVIAAGAPWYYFQVPITLPTQVQNGLMFELQFGAVGAGKNVAITGMQLEPGRIATPYELRSLALELLLCQRYYQIIPISWLFTSNGVGSYGGGVLPMTAPMRVTPSVSDPTGTFTSSQNVNVTGCSAMAYNHVRFFFNSSGGAGAVTEVQGGYTRAYAEL